MTREEALIMQLLNRARTIAVVGASPRPEQHSHTVVAYLHRVGYDVIPVRPDLQQMGSNPMPSLPIFQFDWILQLFFAGSMPLPNWLRRQQRSG